MLKVRYSVAQCEVFWSVNVCICPASSLVQHQQFALKAYSSYTPGPVDSKLGKKHRDDL